MLSSNWHVMLWLTVCKIFEVKWTVKGPKTDPLSLFFISHLVTSTVMQNFTPIGVTVADISVAEQIHRISAGARVVEQGGPWAVLGAHGERVEREPITGVWGQSPQRGPGAEPLVRGSKPPCSWKLFISQTCNGQSKFVPFAVFSAIHYNKIERCKIRAGTPT